MKHLRDLHLGQESEAEEQAVSPCIALPLKN